MPGSTRAPRTLGGTTASLMIYTRDVDAAFHHAVDAGAKVRMEPQDMFWGDRYGVINDPFGHTWAFCTHQKDMTPEQMVEASKAAFSGAGCDR